MRKVVLKNKVIQRVKKWKVHKTVVKNKMNLIIWFKLNKDKYKNLKQGYKI